MPKESFSRLADLLPHALQHYNVASGVYAAQIVNQWPSIAQRILALSDPHQTTARSIKNQTLTVEVANSTIAQAIQLAKLELIAELNKPYDTPRVKDIRCIQN